MARLRAETPLVDGVKKSAQSALWLHTVIKWIVKNFSLNGFMFRFLTNRNVFQEHLLLGIFK